MPQRRDRGQEIQMEYRDFGKTGWRVSAIGVGCWQFGGALTLDGKPDGWTGISDEESAATIQRAVDLGINFFDTADMYGWGHSEEVVGKALKPHRDHINIATKVGFWHDANGQRTLNDSKDYIVRACDASLRRLQTDRIDLYQCHLWRTERWAEFLDAFETLEKQGKIRFYGVSTNDFDMVQRFNERKHLASVQSNYNLLDRHVEKETLPYCKEHNIACIARGPFAMGKLSGKLTKNHKFDADDIRSRWLEDANREAFERDIETVDRLKPIAQKLRCSMAELVLRFVLAHPAVSVAICGTKNRQQLESNVAAGTLPPLTDNELKAVEQALAPV
jgi:aryl-alcohol dehydrogenase-like predicted oxidoreductase